MSIESIAEYFKEVNIDNKIQLSIKLNIIRQSARAEAMKNLDLHTLNLLTNCRINKDK